LSEKAAIKESKKKKKLRSLLFRVCRDLLIVGIAMGCFVIFSTVGTEASVSKYVYENADKIPYNEYALLLGTSKTIGGKENIYFTDRMKAAALLFHKKKIKYIIVSGAFRPTPLYDSPSDMKISLLALNVPADRIIKDNCGYRTLDSIYRAYDVFGIKKFTVISQYSHITRAIYIARSRDLDVIGFAADDGKKRFFTLRDRIREYSAKAKMMLDLYILNTQAKVPLEKNISPAGS